MLSFAKVLVHAEGQNIMSTNLTDRKLRGSCCTYWLQIDGHYV